MFVAVTVHRCNTKVKITQQIFKNKNKHVKVSKQKKLRETGEHAWAETCFATTVSPKWNVSIEWQVISTKNVLSSGRNAINPQRVNTTEGPISCSMHSSGSPETCPNNEKLCFPKPLICVSIYTMERAENKFLTPEFDKHYHETAIHKLSSLFFGFTKNIKIAGGQTGSNPLHLCLWPLAPYSYEGRWALAVGSNTTNWTLNSCTKILMSSSKVQWERKLNQ